MDDVDSIEDASVMSNTAQHSNSHRLALTRPVLVAALAMLTAACTMRGLVGVDINDDGSGVFEVTIAFDEELRALLEEDAEEPIDWTDPSSFEGEDSPADLVDEFPEGATVSPYTEDDYEGFTVDIEFSSLAELDQILSETSSDGEEAFPFRITEQNRRYELSTYGDLFEEAEPTEDEMDFLSDAMLEDLFDLQLRVRLPGEIVSTNADETNEEGVMVWRLDPMADDPTRPEAVSELSSSTAVPLLIVMSLLVLGGAVTAIVLLRRRSSEVPGNASETSDMPDPGAG